MSTVDLQVVRTSEYFYMKSTDIKEGLQDEDFSILLHKAIVIKMSREGLLDGFDIILHGVTLTY